ncbi:anti-sigma factor domain-containing protein [Aneurinibacillus sp. BA2021]|nr:anti-sigma factor domain-containing protein [Aneurinibacillus sp. BA2021]
MKKKGIVLEIQGQHLIVMTSGGRFCKVPPPGGPLKEGDEIEFTHTIEEKESARSKQHAWTKWTYTAAACLLLLITAFPLWNMVFASAYAMVSIDINPSFELEVDEAYNVTDIHALNKEGEQVLSDVAWKDHALIEVTKSILSEAREQGYLKTNHDVLIVPIGLKDPKASQALLEVMKKEVPSITGSNMEELTVTMMDGTEEIRKQAQKFGISAGRYALYESMKRMHKDVGEDNIRSLSISEVSSAIGGFKNIPNAVQYSNRPSTAQKMTQNKKPPAPAPAAHAQPAKPSMPVKEAQAHAKKQAAVAHAEREPSPVKQAPRLTKQEQADKSKAVPKLIAAEQKHKAAVQAQKNANKTDEDRKYQSAYGNQQQKSQQGGQVIKEQEKERNEKYKEEREKNKQHFVRPPGSEKTSENGKGNEKKESESDKESSSQAKKEEK